MAAHILTALNQIKNDGRYERIYNKWIKSTGWIKNVQ